MLDQGDRVVVAVILDGGDRPAVGGDDEVEITGLQRFDGDLGIVDDPERKRVEVGELLARGIGHPVVRIAADLERALRFVAVDDERARADGLSRQVGVGSDGLQPRRRGDQPPVPGEQVGEVAPRQWPLGVAVRAGEHGERAFVALLDLQHGALGIFGIGHLGDVLEEAADEDPRSGRLQVVDHGVDIDGCAVGEGDAVAQRDGPLRDSRRWARSTRRASRAPRRPHRTPPPNRRTCAPACSSRRRSASLPVSTGCPLRPRPRHRGVRPRTGSVSPGRVVTFDADDRPGSTVEATLPSTTSARAQECHVLVRIATCPTIRSQMKPSDLGVYRQGGGTAPFARRQRPGSAGSGSSRGIDGEDLDNTPRAGRRDERLVGEVGLDKVGDQLGGAEVQRVGPGHPDGVHVR